MQLPKTLARAGQANTGQAKTVQVQVAGQGPLLAAGQMWPLAFTHLEMPLPGNVAARRILNQLQLRQQQQHLQQQQQQQRQQLHI